MTKYQIKVADVTDAATRNPAFTASISTDAGQTFIPVQGKFSSWENATNAAKDCLSMTVNNDLSAKEAIFLAFSFIIPFTYLYFNEIYFNSMGYIGIFIVSLMCFSLSLFAVITYAYKKDGDDIHEMMNNTKVL